MITLSRVRKLLWLTISEFIRWEYVFLYKLDIGKDVIISYRSYIDKGVPRKIHIGEGTWVLARATILAHDICRGINTHTYIGKHCVVGINSIIMPGVHIGDEVVIGGGCLVTKDVPDRCVVVGNPGRIIKTGIQVRNGRIINDGKRVEENNK